MKKILIIGFLSLFFITSNVGFSDFDEKILNDVDYSREYKDNNMDFVYSNVRIKDDKLIFKQSFNLYKDMYVQIIGDKFAFPQDVTNNKQNLKIIKRQGLPYVYLKKGEHNLKGTIILNPDIKQIKVPEYINLVEFVTDENKKQIVNLSSNYLHLKAINTFDVIDDDELLSEIVDIANSIDLNLKKVMFHFTLDTF